MSRKFSIANSPLTTISINFDNISKKVSVAHMYFNPITPHIINMETKETTNISNVVSNTLTNKDNSVSLHITKVGSIHISKVSIISSILSISKNL